MYLRPFLLIQILAFLTTQIWACLRLRSFGLEFMTKLKALMASGYVPIPLPHEMANYLPVGSLVKAGTFFTFTLGFTLGIVAFGGAFFLNRYDLSKPSRFGWTVLVSALLSFLLGFSVVEFLLLTAFFGLAHLVTKVPEAPFQKAALISLIPLILIPLACRDQGFLMIRDYLLQNSWGKRTVTFYYQYSPLSAELITPPAERTQVAILSEIPLGREEKVGLLRRGIYPLSTREGADLVIPGEEATAAAVLEAVRKETRERNVNTLRKAIYYSIFVSAPLGIMLFFLLATERLFRRSTYHGLSLIVGLAVLSALLIYHSLSQNTREPTATLPTENIEEVRRWALWTEKTGDRLARESFLELLDSNNPTVRLWAATALAYLPSKDNVEILKSKALQEPVAIVRCKAIFALSHQGDREVIPFLESRLKGKEDWYVKHYLFRALRRLGWIG